MTFRLANIAGRAALCTETHYFDLERLSGGTFSSDPMAAIGRYQELHTVALDGQPDGELASADIGPAVPSPRSSFAVGLNYKSHAAESNMELPANPLVFTKFPSCLVGPNANVELRTTTGDYEVELVVVIGRVARDVPESDAWDFVAGLTIGQDISDRGLQFAAKPPHFDLGKSRDTFGPIGPVIVSTDAFENVDDIALRCTINGEPRQNDRTSNLIFSVPKLIAYLSSILTLVPGDVIFTGTPEGVGAATRNYLKVGDVIVSEIPGIGQMRNLCV